MLVIVVVLIAILMIGVPIGVTFAISALLGGQLLDIPFASFASLSNQAVSSFSLLAIPLFILAGQIMNQGSIISQLIQLSEKLLKKIHGSLGYVTVLASAFLGAITGSSVATVSAIGSSIGHKMVEKGYDRGYTASLIAAAGLLGVFIPPSIPLILYGATVGASISDLFIASIVPGIVFVLAYLVLHRILLKKVYHPENASISEETKQLEKQAATESLGRTFLKTIPALIMPIIVLGGIYSGIFTPTEAAAVACVYGLVLAVVTKKIKFSNLFSPFKLAAISSAAILGIIAFSNLFNYMITLEQIPQLVSEAAMNLTDNKFLFLLLLILILFVVGMFMETNAAVLLMAVLLAPAAQTFEINPIHFGIILVTTIEIGLLTPPMAANVFVSAKVNKSSVLEMMPHTLKFLLVSIIVLLIVAFVPFLTTWFL
ncbi:TRAP transporter large permease [Ureibacillus chungkukjangi]|uniref:Tripartite ATP-independent transporter DctM subunit n=1 Tax=Ureibacillus chungkukjangi TaxID=1202712 RepID=A0A318TTF8_9BACL|nr:TRAP transporter large permease [Ureibacillus chungkukjangi]MCM3389369.1 TRAP transporter large permease [Ureibacillus chungkukjangi]PYF05135.1 tripartite ATP-independent transporter DctM subunit [Ureibacillus chungkukjangi]